MVAHPAQIVTDAIAALSRRDWNAFVPLFDPVSVNAFKRDLEWQFKEPLAGDDITLEDFMSQIPDVPRAVAEYNFEALQKSRLDPEARLKLEIPTISSVQELRSLDAGEVLRRWLQSKMLDETGEYASSTWEPIPGMEVVEIRKTSPALRLRYTVLGSVRDGDEFAHVVCRDHWERDEIVDEDDSDSYTIPADERELSRELAHRSRLHTVTCRRRPDGSWRIIAGRELFFMPYMSSGSLAED
jgi:hypothetical protein